MDQLRPTLDKDIIPHNLGGWIRRSLRNPVNHDPRRR